MRKLFKNMTKDDWVFAFVPDFSCGFTSWTAEAFLSVIHRSVQCGGRTFTTSSVWFYRIPGSLEGIIRENLVYNAEGIPDSRLDEVCKAVGLYHFIRTLPKGYDTILNDHVALSQHGFYADLYNSQFEQPA